MTVSDTLRAAADHIEKVGLLQDPRRYYDLDGGHHPTAFYIAGASASDRDRGRVAAVSCCAVGAIAFAAPDVATHDACRDALMAAGIGRSRRGIEGWSDSTPHGIEGWSDSTPQVEVVATLRRVADELDGAS